MECTFCNWLILLLVFLDKTRPHSVSRIVILQTEHGGGEYTSFGAENLNYEGYTESIGDNSLASNLPMTTPPNEEFSEDMMPNQTQEMTISASSPRFFSENLNRDNEVVELGNNDTITATGSRVGITLLASSINASNVNWWSNVEVTLNQPNQINSDLHSSQTLSPSQNAQQANFQEQNYYVASCVRHNIDGRYGKNFANFPVLKDLDESESPEIKYEQEKDSRPMHEDQPSVWGNALIKSVKRMLPSIQFSRNGGKNELKNCEINTTSSEIDERILNGETINTALIRRRWSMLRRIRKKVLAGLIEIRVPLAYEHVLSKAEWARFDFVLSLLVMKRIQWRPTQKIRFQYLIGSILLRGIQCDCTHLVIAILHSEGVQISEDIVSNIMSHTVRKQSRKFTMRLYLDLLRAGIQPELIIVEMIVQCLGTPRNDLVDFGLGEIERLKLSIQDTFINFVISRAIQTQDKISLGLFLNSNLDLMLRFPESLESIQSLANKLDVPILIDRHRKAALYGYHYYWQLIDTALSMKTKSEIKRFQRWHIFLNRIMKSLSGPIQGEIEALIDPKGIGIVIDEPERISFRSCVYRMCIVEDREKCIICLEGTTNLIYNCIECGPRNYHHHCLMRTMSTLGKCPNCREPF